MSLTYIDYPNREEWLKGRINTLGASEIASAMGMGFMSQIDLWKIKTGRMPAKDISQSSRVKYGTDAEEHLRALFALKHKNEYRVEYHPYRTYINTDIPFMSCTLDGELVRLSDGARGIWEGKTVWIIRSSELEEWNGKIKQAYYIQVLGQLDITKWDFAIVTVEIIFPDKNSEIRHYQIERSGAIKAISTVENGARKFWGYVESNKQPPITVRL